MAHRLGLVPIFADPRKFEMKKEKDDQTDATTLVFRLEVCSAAFSPSADCCTKLTHGRLLARKPRRVRGW